MKPLVITADLHLHPFKLNSNDGGRDRLRDGLDALDQTLNIARVLGATWIFAGDMKVPRTTWVQEALNGAYEILEAYADVDKILLPGNHDGPKLPGGSGLRAFASIERTSILELPTLLPAIAPGLAVWPGEFDLDALPGWIEEARSAGCVLLLGHGLFEGCLLSPGIAAPGGLTLSAFGLGGESPAFRLAVFGDVHRGQIYSRGRWVPWDRVFSSENGHQWGRQKWGDPEGNTLHITKGFFGQIIYPGDPYQQNWGEAGEVPKGVTVIFPETEEISVVPIKAPLYIAQDWTDSTFDAFEEYARNDGEATWEGNFVRLILPDWGSTSMAAAILKDVREHHGVRSFEAIIKRAAKAETRVEVDTSMEADDLLASYLKAKPPQDLNEKLVLEAGKRLWGKP